LVRVKIIVSLFSILLVSLVCGETPALVIGPPAPPSWESDAQVKLGWVFDDPQNPENAITEPDWNLAVGTPPSWDYDAGRVAFTYPAQWHIEIPHEVNSDQMQRFWFSFVYEFEATLPGNPSLFSSVVPLPSQSTQGFSFVDEWFTASGDPTTDYQQAEYGRWTAQLEMYPSPDSVELFLGTEPSLSMDVYEVYVIGTTYECVDDSVCTDDDPCLGDQFCDTEGLYGPRYTCQYDPATAVACDHSNDTECTKNMCDPDTLDCTMTDLEQGTECDDGDACTYDDVCDGAGTCAGSSYLCNPAECEASSVCDGEGGCYPIYEPPGTECDDEVEWTYDDTCNMGVCAGIEEGSCGTPVEVDGIPYEHTTTTVGRPSHVTSYGNGCGEMDAGLLELGQGDVVYELEMQAGQSVTITLEPGAGVDGALAVLSACADGEDCLAWADDAGAGGDEEIELTAEEDGTVYIVVEGGDDPGEHTLLITPDAVDTDSGSDADADADSDADADADSDQDVDTDTSTSSDDEIEKSGSGGGSKSCGCRTPGLEARAGGGPFTLLLSLLWGGSDA
jgi:hypothetical protein